MEAGAASAAPVAGAGTAVATPPPAPSPQYTPPPPPMMPQQPMMAEGGETPSSGSSSFSGKVKDFFSDINILDVAISAFIVGGVLYAVHYYKFMIMLEKSGYADLSTRVQRLESQMASAKKSAEMNATGGKMPMRNKRRGLVTL